MKRRTTSRTGIRVLDADEDFREVFLGEQGEKPAPEDFAAMLEQSFSETDQQSLLRQKQSPAMSKNPVPVREKIKRYPAPEDELDLHGCTAREAEEKAEKFLESARLRGLQTVRIIVGKGTRSPGRAVLPDVIEDILVVQKKTDAILTFQWEKSAKRKSGAVIVYLRKKGPGAAFP